MPNNASNTRLTWTSGDTDVVTVSSSGSVTAVSAGKTYITVSTQNLGLTAICTVTVSSPAPTNLNATNITSTSISLSWDSVSSASSYRIYRANSSSGTYYLVGTSNSESFTNRDLTENTTYYFKVSAVYSNGGESLLSDSIGELTSDNQRPLNVSATALSSTSVTVGWGEVSGAEYYKVYRSTSSGGTYAIVGISTDELSYTDAGLSPHTDYYYKVSAVKSGEESQQSSSANRTTLWQAPQDLSVSTTSTTGIALSWTAVSGVSTDNYYYLWMATSPEGIYTPINTGSISASYTNEGWASATTYYYKVSVGSAGEKSDYISATTLPSAPTGVYITGSSSNSITVGWTPVKSATSYIVYRSSSSSGTYEIAGTSTGATYTDAGFNAGASYYYKVSAVNQGGEGAMTYSSAGMTIPASESDVPTNVTAVTTSSSNIKISWDSINGATGYYVYRSSSSAGTYTKVEVSAVDDTSYTDSVLSAGTRYYYKVSAWDGTEESALSSYASATTLPETLASIYATAQSSSSIRVSWTNATGATYLVYRSDSSAGTYTIVGTSTGTPYNDTGLDESTTYYYKVSTVISGVEGAQSSSAEAETNAVPVPSGLSATAQSASSISLSWTAVSGETAGGYYNVYRSTSSSGPYTQINTVNVTTNSYTNSGLSSNTQYYYKVSFVNSMGKEGEQSQSANARTKLMAPTNVSATATSSTSITVTWSEVDGASSYRVYRSTSSSGVYTQISTGIITNSYTNSGLSANTQYYYKVTAISDSGVEGEESAYRSATTPSATLSAPTGVTAYAYDGGIEVQWNSVSGASYYKVYRSTTSSGTYSLLGSITSYWYWDYNVTPGATYYYKVTAVNSSGTESPQSSYAYATASSSSGGEDVQFFGNLSNNTWRTQYLYSGETHVHPFNANAGYTYTVQIEDYDSNPDQGYADVRFGVYRGDYLEEIQVVIDMRDSNEVSFTPSSTGTYYVVVEGYSNGSSGNYRVRYTYN